ncbi:SpoIIE family protein phosphatase [Carboxylicivirga marina]|uniref:SpoIIE family protein phosphatase n=1 Tax=Carboxylicivirga marina TaxID=2800988 RepID=UPI002598295A|nr:SpoIIE family protein phosphatase [uncultured Carboxylicivirga sp.]
MHNYKIIVVIAGLLYCHCSYAQVLDPIALSRQDSVMVKKNQEAISVHLASAEKREASDFMNQTALLYWEHNQFRKAIEFYNESYKINAFLNNENGMAMINSNLALLHAELKEYDLALDNFFTTYSIRKAKGEKVGAISALINMSIVNNNLFKYDQSIKMLKEALDMSRELNDIEQMKSCYGMLCESYEKAGRVDTAMYFFNLYRTFHEISQDKKVGEAMHKLENERLRAELAEAREAEKELKLLRNTSVIEKREDEIKEVTKEKDKLQDDYTKMELQLALAEQTTYLKEIETKHELELRRKKIIGISTATIFLILGLMFLWRAYRSKEKSNVIISHKNNLLSKLNTENAEYIKKIKLQRDEISIQSQLVTQQKEQLQDVYRDLTDSIQYANRLMKAIFPSQLKISKIVDDFFILNKPKDVISGDFFWINRIGDKIIFAVADCTGHGVPGAFLSVLANTILNAIVIRQGITQTSAILNRMRQEMVFALMQSASDVEILDGLDIALCSFDTVTKELEYSGAHNPLYVIRDDACMPIPGSKAHKDEDKNKTLYEIKGDRMSIGRCLRVGEFAAHRFSVMPNDTIYLFSDGFADQFGGPKGKKFLYSRLRKLLLTNNAKSCPQQKKEIDSEFENWRGDIPRVDDVLLFGAKLLP